MIKAILFQSGEVTDVNEFSSFKNQSDGIYHLSDNDYIIFGTMENGKGITLIHSDLSSKVQNDPRFKLDLSRVDNVPLEFDGNSVTRSFNSNIDDLEAAKPPYNKFKRYKDSLLTKAKEFIFKRD